MLGCVPSKKVPSESEKKEMTAADFQNEVRFPHLQTIANKYRIEAFAAVNLAIDALQRVAGTETEPSEAPVFLEYTEDQLGKATNWILKARALWLMSRVLQETCSATTGA